MGQSDISPHLTAQDVADMRRVDAELIGNRTLRHRSRHGADFPHHLGGQLGPGAPALILGPRHRLQMIRVDARSVATEMVQLHASRDPAVLPFIENDVRPSSFGSPVSAGLNRLLPNPARRLISAILNGVVGSGSPALGRPYRDTARQAPLGVVRDWFAAILTPGARLGDPTLVLPSLIVLLTQVASVKRLVAIWFGTRPWGSLGPHLDLLRRVPRRGQFALPPGFFASPSLSHFSHGYASFGGARWP